MRRFIATSLTGPRELVHASESRSSVGTRGSVGAGRTSYENTANDWKCR